MIVAVWFAVAEPATARGTSGSVRELVYDDRVAQLYLGPTLTARLRARLEAVA